MAPPTPSRRPLLILVALWGVLYIAGLGALDVQGSLEGLRIVVARSMLDTGDWIVPSFAGEAYLLKPPLVNWEIAASGALAGGLSTFAARLPSALAVLATSLLLLAWARRRGAARAGMAAALTYLFLPLVFEKGIRAEIETSLAFFIALSLLALYEATRGARGAPRPPDAARWTLVAAASLALGVLAKGPPALLVFFTTAVPWLAWRGGRVLSLRGALAGAVAASLVLAAWLVPLVHTVGWDRWIETIDVEVLQRARAADPGNQEGALYYLPKLLGGALPAFLLIVCLRRSSLLARFAPALLYLSIWVIGPLLAFSLFSGKESRYLLPLYPALALLAGFGFEALLEKRPGLVPHLSRIVVGLLVLAIAVKAVWLLAVVPHQNEKKSPRTFATAVATHVGLATPLTFVGQPRAQLLYYLNRPIVHVKTSVAWTPTEAEPPAQAVLMPLETVEPAAIERIRRAMPDAAVHELRWGKHPYLLLVGP